MIRIYRTNPAPDILIRGGQRQTVLDCAAYENDPEAYKSHKRTFHNKEYYSEKAVKDLLRKMHRDKCCYCETKIGTPAYLQIEHFRPKAAVRQSRDENNEFPGYYWLAYSWENLLLACFDCNTTYKNTVFPLENPAERARSHKDDLAKETQRFVNPSEEDPRDHIRFDRDFPVAKTERGRHTIKGLGLRRSALRELRQEWVEKVEMAITIIKIVEAMPSVDNEAYQETARKFIEKAVQPNEKFSSMVMDRVAHRNLQ